MKNLIPDPENRMRLPCAGWHLVKKMLFIVEMARQQRNFSYDDGNLCNYVFMNLIYRFSKLGDLSEASIFAFSQYA